MISTVEEYYELRAQAAVTGDVGPLYGRHPGLAKGEIRGSQVNVEAFFVERMRALGVQRVSLEMEWYEPVRVYVREDRALAYVHGIETWEYPRGPTKGELYVRIDLVRSGDRWSIERTDEWGLGETPAPSPRTR